MTHIKWHNPANETPPKGYRLLIPEEVDGRFNSQDCKAVQIYRESEGWKETSAIITADCIRYSYAVPSDTLLPEGHTLIDGQVWRVEKQASKPMTATEMLGQQSKSPSERRMDAAIQQLRQQLEDIKSVLDENQRLKCELADAHATLISIRSMLP